MTQLTSTDQMGFTIRLEAPPRRIVSLVPSQTELLYDLGLEDRIVGITKFCVHPEHARKTKVIVGGTKKFDLERIVHLNPDLIIGNKEENYQEGIDYLRQRFPVWMSDIYTLDDALKMTAALSALTQRDQAGESLILEIREAFAKVRPLAAVSVLYLMWYNPWMGSAGKTFINDILQRMGFHNVLADRERYPVLTESEIRGLRPDVVFLSSEPFPFSDKHGQAIRSVLPQAQVLHVDGEMFSWYGSRLLKTASYFGELAARLNRM